MPLHPPFREQQPATARSRDVIVFWSPPGLPLLERLSSALGAIRATMRVRRAEPYLLDRVPAGEGVVRDERTRLDAAHPSRCGERSFPALRRYGAAGESGRARWHDHPL